MLKENRSYFCEKKLLLHHSINDPLKENKVLYFYNDDCPPCMALRPKIEFLLKKEFPLMNLIFINAAQNPEYTASMMIFSAPTIVVFFEGKEYMRYGKNASVMQIKEDLQRPYSLLFN
ncbi:MAG: thioredoxin family protein [Bacteroidales bacterium]|jgi:thiol-disulfide isomerase/thioredoxin|nr:thioredoxin family protein [Bacteroidales bacterium]